MVSLVVEFGEDSTEFKQADVAENPDLAVKCTVKHRMYYLLRRGAKTVEEIATEIGAEPDTVRRTANRYKDEFIMFQNGMVGLKGRA